MIGIEKFRIFKKSIDTYWPVGDIEIPEKVWMEGWEGVIDYLQKNNKIYGSGYYAVQNTLGAGFCVFSVDVPEPTPVVKIL